MTEKTAPWWRSFVGKRRKAARESAAILEQDLRSQGVAGSTQHPAAEHDQRRNTPACTKDGGKRLPSDDTYDDSAVQPTFSESTNRRALTVSRSGRFKEKGRRTRVGLPQSDEGTPAAAKSTDSQSKR